MKHILGSEISQPLTCWKCKYRFWDELLQYCLCQINERPYLESIDHMWQCDGYLKGEINEK